MSKTTHVRRPRFRAHRRLSRRLAKFLADMATKWSGHEATTSITSVGSSVLVAAGAPGTSGPFTIRGAVPPELRGIDRFWVVDDGSHNLSVYQSRKDAGAARSVVDFASWALTLAFKSLTSTAPTAATFGTPVVVATLGTPLSVSAVTNGSDSLTITSHGLALDDGPFYVTASVTFPTGLAATTPYWVAAVTDANTIKLAASKGGAIINLTGDGSGTITLVPVNVDVETNALKSTAHGLTTGQLVQVSTSSALPTGLAATTNYWVVAVDANHVGFASSLVNANAGTKIDLTGTGAGNQTISPCNVDTTLDTIKSTAHGYVTGDGPIRLTTSSALPTGLLTATDYYAVRIDADHLQLADTYAHAIAGSPTIIDLTGTGAGTTTMTLAGVDVTAEDLRAVAHGMETGDGPVTTSTDGTLPTGLAAATPYYVVKVDADHFGLASSHANALLGTKINLTGIGSGNHTLARALTIGKDLSAAGLLEWLAQGISPAQMTGALVGAVDTVFA